MSLFRFSALAVACLLAAAPVFAEELKMTDKLHRQLIDTDPAYKDADSLALLSRVGALAGERGFSIVDCDCTVAAQAPKLMPYRQRMRENLAASLGLDVERVGVKATTTEGLGFVGREEGIAAWAVVLLERP